MPRFETIVIVSKACILNLRLFDFVKAFDENKNYNNDARLIRLSFVNSVFGVHTAS